MDLAFKSSRIVDFAVNLSDSRILKTQWKVDYSCEFWRRFRIVPFLMIGSWVLNEIWTTDGRFEFIRNISFEVRCETVIKTVLCYTVMEL